MSAKRNVVIFGETGVGKSSLINMIFNEEIAETSSGALGCTLESKCYTIKRGNYIFNIYDVAGLNEADRGNIQPDVAIRKLIELLISLKEGVHLLIMCIRMGRMSASASANYQLFYEKVCEKSVPILLVVTHCELSNPIDQWRTENESKLANPLKMYFTQIICVTTLNKGNHAAKFLEEYTQSRRDVCKAIIRYSLDDPWIVQIDANRISIWIKKLWNVIADFIKLPKIPLNRVLYEILKKFYSEEEAMTRSNEIAESINQRVRMQPG